MQQTLRKLPGDAAQWCSSMRRPESGNAIGRARFPAALKNFNWQSFARRAKLCRFESRAMSATGRQSKRKLKVTFIATAAILLVGSLAFKADAQTSRGAATIPAQAQNFTPIENAACGPFWGSRCGPSITGSAVHTAAAAGARAAELGRNFRAGWSDELALRPPAWRPFLFQDSDSMRAENLRCSPGPI